VTAPASGVIAVERTQLPNGLAILSEFVPGVRSIVIGAWVRAGSVHERRDDMGVSHLLEHLVFKGTGRRTAREIALALEARGGSLDAFTGREHTAFQAHVLDRDLAVAVDLLRDLMFEPLLRESDLDLERNVILDEIAQVEDTPDDLVFEEHNALLWGNHPYGYSILGTRATVGSMPLATIRERHQGAYAPDNVVLAAAGNVRHGELLERLLAAGWGDLPRKGASQPVVPAPIALPPTHRHITRDAQQTHIVFGSTTIPMVHDTRPAFLIVCSLLGGGMSSRLFQRVRETLGLAYSVYGFHSLYTDIGIHGVYVGTAPASAEKARAAVTDELRRLVDDGIREDELALGREQLIGQYLLSQESVGARMHWAASRELYGEPYRSVEDVIRRIEAVTPVDALAVARAWFAPERQTVLTLGPRDT
jgi:predicted Zn-dependent peptidase